MKKIVLILFGLISYLGAYSQVPNPTLDYTFRGQVSVGTGSPTYVPTDSSAWLEIGKDGTTKGMIIPRVNDTSDITGRPAGMVVYQKLDKQVYSADGVMFNRIGADATVTAVDSLYRSNDTLYYHLTDGRSKAVKMDYFTQDQTKELVHDSISVIPKYWNVDTVQTIDQLEGYSGDAYVLVVTDSSMGGIFYYIPTGTPNGGTVFQSVNGGYWKRIYDSYLSRYFSAEDTSLIGEINGSIIREGDIEKLQSLFYTSGVRYSAVGNSLSAGTGYDGASYYGEANGLVYPSPEQFFSLNLIQNDPFFEPVQDSVYHVFECKDPKSINYLLTKIPVKSWQLKMSDSVSLSFKIKRSYLNNPDSICLYYLSRTSDSAAMFDVNGETIDTYSPPVNYIGDDNAITYRIESVMVPVQNLNGFLSVHIGNIRTADRGNGMADEGHAVIIGFSLGRGVSFRNWAVRSTTLKDSSNINIARGVTTSERMDSAFSINPNVITIEWGTNDSKTGVSTPYEYQKELKYRIDQIRSKDQNSIIILVGAPMGMHNHQTQYNYIYNKIMRDVAYEKKVNYYDAQKTFYKNWSTYVDDVHQDSLGYYVMGESISKMMGIPVRNENTYIDRRSKKANPQTADINISGDIASQVIRLTRGQGDVYNFSHIGLFNGSTSGDKLRWGIGFVDQENTDNNGANLAFYRYSNSGGVLDTITTKNTVPFAIERRTGNVHIGNSLFLSKMSGGSGNQLLGISPDGSILPKDNFTAKNSIDFSDNSTSSTGIFLKNSSTGIPRSYIGSRYSSGHIIMSGNSYPTLGEDKWNKYSSSLDSYAITIDNNGIKTYRSPAGTSSGTFSSFFGSGHDILDDSFNPDWSATSGPEQILNKPDVGQITNLAYANLTQPDTAELRTYNLNGNALYFQGSTENPFPGQGIFIQDNLITAQTGVHGQESDHHTNLVLSSNGPLGTEGVELSMVHGGNQFAFHIDTGKIAMGVAGTESIEVYPDHTIKLNHVPHSADASDSVLVKSPDGTIKTAVPSNVTHLPIKSVSANYTLTEDDYDVVVSGTDTEITIPDAASMPNKMFFLRAYGDGMDVNCATGSQLQGLNGGSPTGTIANVLQYHTIELHSDGTLWYFIDR